MIKQKYSRKVVAQNKKRISIFQLANDIKRQHGLQQRINARQAKLNTMQAITTEEIIARMATLERIILDDKRIVKKPNIFRRFWDWTVGK